MPKLVLFLNSFMQPTPLANASHIVQHPLGLRLVVSGPALEGLPFRLLEEQRQCKECVNKLQNVTHHCGP